MNTDEAMECLKHFLRTTAIAGKYPLDEYGDAITPTGDWTCETSPAAEIAREWCKELLEASQANGLGACRLCQS